MKLISGATLVPALLLFSLSIAKNGNPRKPQTAPAPSQASVRYKSALLPAYADNLKDMIRVVGGPGAFRDHKSSADSLITKLAVDSGNSEEYEKLYNFVRAAGLHNRDSVGLAFFEAAPIYDLLIEGLGHPERAIRLKTMALLLEYGKPNQLAVRKANILEALRKPNTDSSFHPTLHAELLALLPLTSEERSQLNFNRKLLSRRILARLGDSSAEESLIRDFKKSADLSSKRSLAEELGYVGSPKCARVLAEEFFAPLTNRGLGNSVSFQFYAVKAMARIYPDEPLFTTVFMILTTVAKNYHGDERNGVPGMRKRNQRLEREVVQYFHEVSTWLQKNLGVTPRHPVPEKPILIQ